MMQEGMLALTEGMLALTVNPFSDHKDKGVDDPDYLMGNQLSHEMVEMILVLVKVMLQVV